MLRFTYHRTTRTPAIQLLYTEKEEEKEQKEDGNKVTTYKSSEQLIDRTTKISQSNLWK